MKISAKESKTKLKKIETKKKCRVSCESGGVRAGQKIKKKEEVEMTGKLKRRGERNAVLEKKNKKQYSGDKLNA